MSNAPRDRFEAAGALPPTVWSGTAYRHTAPGREALSGSGALRFGGRWNPPDLVATIYLAFPREACVAEFRRMAEGQGRGPTSFLPRDIHQITVTGLEVLDLTTEEALERVGLSPASIHAVDWGPCQRVGEAAHFLGFQGILAPSATGMGSVLAVFEPRIRRGQLVLARTETLRLDA